MTDLKAYGITNDFIKIPTTTENPETPTLGPACYRTGVVPIGMELSICVVDKIFKAEEVPDDLTQLL
jgi:hypothetical protein